MALLLRALAIVSLIVAFTAGAAQPAAASHAWSTYHWGRTANPFTLGLGSNVTGDWVGHLSTTSANWSVSSVLDTVVVAGGTTGRKCRPTSGRVEVCNAKYGSNGWLGLAQIWLSNGHIVQGLAKMNDTYFTLDRYNNPNEKQHVMCQEVGHTFGLGHTSEDGSSQNTCMDYFSNTGVNAGSTLSTAPNAHDYEQLELIYAHLDSTTTVGSLSAAAGFGADDGNNWGRLVASTARSSTYVRDVSPGKRIVTHVTWAR
ncbi:MAG TPA: hypothetical protein VFM93_01225 [Candidatus Limnocylindria bacterium]|nr:hypothetical protein [Candidatus Limnocylindria bacterium]